MEGNCYKEGGIGYMTPTRVMVIFVNPYPFIGLLQPPSPLEGLWNVVFIVIDS